jgi:primase-polymerase (primpol)-like protein
LLKELQKYKNWIVWNPFEIDNSGKHTKIPYSVASNGTMRASVKEPSSWTTLEFAQDFVKSNPHFQIGFVLTALCGLTCVDLDSHKVPASDPIRAEHKQIHDWLSGASRLVWR